MHYLLYGFLYPVSMPPMRVLYLISDGIYAIIYFNLGYRRSELACRKVDSLCS